MLEQINSPEDVKKLTLNKKQKLAEEMRKYIIEEAYETVEAINDKDKTELCEELGDLLFQVVFQAKMAEEAGLFDINDVIAGISNKMIMRHPHIFGGENAEDFKVSLDNGDETFLGKWEDNKKKEKGYTTQTEVLRAIPESLPALMRAEKVLFKAENAGFVLEKADEGFVCLNALLKEAGEADTDDKSAFDEKVGDILLKMTNISRKMQINAEFSLTKAIEKFINMFEYSESSAAKDNVQPKMMSGKLQSELLISDGQSAADEK